MQQPPFIHREYPERYSLIVRIGPEMFSFCIYQPNVRENFSFQHIPFSFKDEGISNMEEIILDSEFLTLPYHSVKVIYVSRDYDLIPQYIIKKDKKESLYNFVHTHQAQQILYCPDTIQQIVTEYNTNDELYKFLLRNLYSSEFYHHSNVIMQYLEKKNRELPQVGKMYLNFHDHFVDIFCYDKTSTILHALTFEKESSQNMLYYILNVWDKCNFDQKKDHLYILDGYNVPDAYITAKLKDYIHNIMNLPVTNDINPFANIPENERFPLDLLILTAK